MSVSTKQAATINAAARSYLSKHTMPKANALKHVTVGDTLGMDGRMPMSPKFIPSWSSVDVSTCAADMSGTGIHTQFASPSSASRRRQTTVAEESKFSAVSNVHERCEARIRALVDTIADLETQITAQPRPKREDATTQTEATIVSGKEWLLKQEIERLKKENADLRTALEAEPLPAGGMREVHKPVPTTEALAVQQLSHSLQAQNSRLKQLEEEGRGLKKQIRELQDSALLQIDLLWSMSDIVDHARTHTSLQNIPILSKILEKALTAATNQPKTDARYTIIDEMDVLRGRNAELELQLQQEAAEHQRLQSSMREEMERVHALADSLAAVERRMSQLSAECDAWADAATRAQVHASTVESLLVASQLEAAMMRTKLQRTELGSFASDQPNESSPASPHDTLRGKAARMSLSNPSSNQLTSEPTVVAIHGDRSRW